MDREQLQHAVETGLFLLPKIPGQLARAPIAGIRTRVTPVSHPLGNIVGAAALDPLTASATIAEVFDYFAANRTTFAWRVGPTTRPPGLGDALLRAGMRRQESLTGMAFTHAVVPCPRASDVEVREATLHDAAVVAELIHDAYPVPMSLASILTEAYLCAAGESRPSVRSYLAIERTSGDPMAFGTSYYFPDRPVAVLGGAATLPAFRGRGAYATLVTHRLRAANRRGASAVVVQAVKATSAPILARMGFTTVCEIDAYVKTLDETGQ